MVTFNPSRLINTSTIPIILVTTLFSTAANAEKWKMDLTKTKVNFEVTYLKKMVINGKFHDVDGTISYDEDHPEKTKVQFTVYSNSVDTDLKPRDYFIRRKELLNTKQYPTLKFKSTDVRLINPRMGYLSGKFTALGQTKPMTVKVTLTDAKGGKKALNFTATGLINRHDYGVTAFPNIFGTTVPITISGQLIPDK